MKILFVASEAAPFAKSGGLGDVAGALPKEIKNQGHDIRVVIPYYKEDIAEKFQKKMEYIGCTFAELGWRKQYCGVFQIVHNDVTYYFLDNEFYFKRKGLYGHFDDGERFAFFSKGVLEILGVVDFWPDLIHTNDWQTALVPVFLDVFYRFSENYRYIKTVFTIHNIEFQGKFSDYMFGDVLGLPDWAIPLVEYKGNTNFMKGAIETANIVTTVSENYANEILHPFYSYGLESILKEREYKLHGVVNGIDTKIFNPKTDKALFSNYGIRSLLKKEENKKGLLELCDLPYVENRPVIAMVTRLTEQKGMDLIMAVIEEIMAADVEFIILGTGDWKYESSLKEIEARYSTKFKAIINFSTDLASKIYAGADMFLMPSKFEPCGLSQMIAMTYATVPIVRETGGLKDTVEAFNPTINSGTGFTFNSYNSYDMLDAIWRAYGTYFNKDQWNAIQKNAMKADFTWTASAKKYIELYEEI